jgi:putative aldouronate transport system substrate-binding protein
LRFFGNVKRSLMFVLIAVFCVFIFLAGCSDGDESSNSGDTGSSNSDSSNDNANKEEPSEDLLDAWKSDEPLEFSSLVIDWGDHSEDQRIWSTIKEATNVKINTVPVPNTDYTKKAKLMLSTGEAPDIIAKVSQSDIEQFIPSGVILPVSDYLEYFPHFTARMEKWGLKEEVENLRQLDGKFYVLPGIKESPYPNIGIHIRSDLLKKYNLDMPQNYNEFYEVLKKFKEGDPSSFPLTDKFNGEQLLMIASAAFGTQAGWDYNNGMQYDKASDSWIYAGTDSRYKEMIEYFAKLVREGLMDPELFTQTGGEKFKKLANEKSFLTSGAFPMQNRLYRDKQNDYVEWEFMLPPAGPAGRISIATSPFEFGVVFPAKVQKNENFEQLLRFVDWLYFSDEGNTLTFWGVEGETYEIVDGKKKLLPDYKWRHFNPDGEILLGKEWGTGNNNWKTGGSNEFYEELMDDGERKFYNKLMSEVKIQTTPPTVLMTDMQREQFTLVNAALEDYTKQMLLKFILGDASIEDDWDTYVKETEGKGAQKLLDIYNEAWEATKESKK